MKVLILHGANLNLLGKRESDLYGHKSLDELNNDLIKLGSIWNVKVDCHQSNIEGELIDFIHKAEGIYNHVIFNPGAYTHYCYALRDAISSVNVPVIEVHMTNIYRRESFREKSVIAPVCEGQISGFGYLSYELALKKIIQLPT